MSHQEYCEEGLEAIQQYQEAGASRRILSDLATASSRGIEVVRRLAPVVEQAPKV